MQEIDGFILVGGRSTRMGTDKASLKLARRSLTSHVADALQTVTDSIALVGRPGFQPSESFPFVTDVYPDCGALSGIHAAFNSSNRKWILVVACDLPFVTGELLQRLALFRTGYEAVAPIQRDGIPQPLCALYQVDPCRERAGALLESGERRPLALLQSVATRWVSFEELSDLTSATDFFDNINTPDDFARAVQRKVGNNPR